MTEDHIEQSMLETLRQIGWSVLHGPDIGPDGGGEREYRDTVLNHKLAGALYLMMSIFTTFGIDRLILAGWTLRNA